MMALIGKMENEDHVAYAQGLEWGQVGSTATTRRPPVLSAPTTKSLSAKRYAPSARSPSPPRLPSFPPTRSVSGSISTKQLNPRVCLWRKRTRRDEAHAIPIALDPNHNARVARRRGKLLGDGLRRRFAPKLPLAGGRL